MTELQLQAIVNQQGIGGTGEYNPTRTKPTSTQHQQTHKETHKPQTTTNIGNPIYNRACENHKTGCLTLPKPSQHQQQQTHKETHKPQTNKTTSSGRKKVNQDG
jgi:hypothetical protein